jgi:phosphoribosylformimino-5-aminoimidazole carboxamide ribotide isomerase
LMEAILFTIYPAIDLRKGRVVRLMQGDPTRQTDYYDDPAVAARRWLEAGARWLHVVNLDGAFGESGDKNLAALEAILETAAGFTPTALVQFGGGLRSLENIQRALTVGVSRVMLGTMAVENPDLAARALSQYGPERIGLAMDARDGEVQVRGWQSGAGLDPLSLGRQFYEMGLRTCAYTDVNRDGGGAGINLAATERFARATGLAVIASGGADSLEDVRLARGAGLSGIIIGRALYEGRIDLQEALAC